MGFPWTEHFDSVAAPSTPTGWTFGSAFYETTTGTAGITPVSSPNMLWLPNTGLDPITGLATNYFGIYGSPDTNGGDVTLTCCLNGDTDTPLREFDLGLVARADSTSVTRTSGTFYWLEWDIAAANVNLYAVVSGSRSLLHTFTLATSVPGWLRFTWVLLGTSITLAIQRLSDGSWYDPSSGFVSSPSTAMSTTDSSISGAGYGGIVGENRSDAGVFWDDWTFDVAVAPTSPPIYPQQRPIGPPPGATGPWATPSPSVVLPGLPSPSRTGGLFLPPWVAAPPEETPPRVVVIPPPPVDRAPVVGPAPIVAPTPGSLADEPIPPRVASPSGLPSPGAPPPSPGVLWTPSRPMVPPPDDAPAAAWPPIGLPSPGSPTPTPTPTGPPGPPAVVRPPEVEGAGIPGPFGWGLARQVAGLPTPGPTPTPTPTSGGPFSLGGFGGSGPCCCTPHPPPCGVTICVTGCPSGTPLVGATVTVTQGGDPVGTCTTLSPTGCCGIPIAEAGTYEVSVTATGYKPYDGTMDLECGETVAIELQPDTANPSVRFTVTGCCFAPLPGVTITLSDGQSCTTDAAGQCRFWLGAAGSYAYTASKPPRWANHAGSVAIANCATATTDVAFTMTPASGYACGLYAGTQAGTTGAIADPIPTTLHLTDSVYGAVTLIFDAGLNGWQGTLAVSVAALCNCPAESFTITYFLTGNCSTVCFLDITAPKCTYEDQFNDVLDRWCHCDGPATFPDGSKLVTTGVSCTPDGSTTTFCFTGKGTFSVSGIPYSFSGTIPSYGCTIETCGSTWYPAGATITVSE